MSSFSEDSSHDGIMSERTLTIAGRIYAELQSMIHSHGDEVIAELMPLIVSVLEELDVAFQECDDAVQALEELRDELSQCKQEIKRQKQLRELLEEEKINGEDVIETERKKLTESQSQLKILNKSMTLNLSAKKEYIQSLEARMVELEKDHRDLERRHIDTIQSLVKSKKTIREQSIVIETKMSESNTSSIKLTPLRSRRNEEYLDLSQPVMTSFEQVQHSTPISKELGAGREEMFNMTLDQELESVVLDDVELKEALDEAEQQEAKISNTPSKEYTGKAEQQEASNTPSKESLSLHTDVGYDENFYDMLDEGRGELEDENPISPHEETGQNLYEELNGVPIGISSPTKHESLLRQASELLESTPRKMSIRSCDGEMNSLLEEKQALEQVRQDKRDEDETEISDTQQHNCNPLLHGPNPSHPDTLHLDRSKLPLTCALIAAHLKSCEECGANVPCSSPLISSPLISSPLISDVPCSSLMTSTEDQTLPQNTDTEAITPEEWPTILPREPLPYGTSPLSSSSAVKMDTIKYLSQQFWPSGELTSPCLPVDSPENQSQGIYNPENQATAAKFLAETFLPDLASENQDSVSSVHPMMSPLDLKTTDATEAQTPQTPQTPDEWPSEADKKESDSTSSNDSVFSYHNTPTTPSKHVVPITWQLKRLEGLKDNDSDYPAARTSGPYNSEGLPTSTQITYEGRSPSPEVLHGAMSQSEIVEEIFGEYDVTLEILYKTQRDVLNKLMKDNEALLQNLRDSESTSELNDNKVKCLELENNNITNKITELETTLKRLQTIQHPLLAISPQSGEKDPFEKRFTRCEMDKVIREKNMYKEKYLELQEDLSTRYVEVQTEKGAANEKSKFWNLFSGLFARKKEEEKEEKEEVKKEKMKKIPNEPKEPSNMEVAKTKQPKSTRHFIQGWSLPHEVATQYISDMDFIQSIPAPIYCGPLGALDQERKSLVRCCATADDAFDNRHMTWVCCERDGQGEVFIVDPGNPTEIKQTFLATKSAIICIEFVPEGGGCDIKMNNMQGSESDSDNESGEFEMCSMERHEYLLTCQPTFWLGTQNGCVLIHSAVEEHDTLLARVRLKDSVLQIKCIKTHNVVLAGCADSSIAVFSRIKGGRWDTDNFKVIMLGDRYEEDWCYRSFTPFGKNLPLPVSVVTPVGEAVWAAYGGNIAVLSMPDANIKDDFMFTEGVRSLITHMVSVGTGVWLAYRFSPVLTLLDSRTRQPIQQINMEDVLRPVSVSYGFTSTIRISALISFNNLLWIGTSQGALVTIPLKTLTPSSTPYITEPPEATEPMFAVRDEARISLHGHQGAVRYLVVAKYCANSEQADRRNSSASNTSESKEVLLRRRYLCTRVMLSGGEGYISYRDMDAGTLSTIRRGRIIRGFTDHCHMIAWDVSGPRTISN